MVNWTIQAVDILIRLIVGTIILHIAAGLVGIHKATLGKAFTIALVAALLSVILGLAANWLGLLSLILIIVVTKAVYETSWFKAIIVWIAYIVVILFIVVILGFLVLALGLALL
jgi:hypothetical protein